MEKQMENCENYQLKWSSYNSYIHSCIATSLNSEDSYADVALVTMDGHQIMAHRFVLAYASQYLSKVLKFQPKVTTSLPIMVVLPPEITFKSLKILVKYMYSGEATVSKDILKTVLRGGDILKVKGLYRESMEYESKSVKSKYSNNSETNGTLQTEHGKSKESSGSNKNAHSTSKQFENKLTEVPKSLPKLSIVSNTKTSEKLPVLKQYTRPKVLNFTMNNYNAIEKEVASPKRTLISNLPLNNKTALQKEKPHTITSAEAEALEASKSLTETDTIKSESVNKSTDNLQYLVIKEEPLEWAEADMELIDEKEVFPELPVKTEAYDSGSNDNELYTPLTCELCTATFTIPAEWVRHVQTHTDMLPAKRRRRDSPDEDEENATYPELQCDLCEKAFSTPAEWVRHIQDSHTEFELSLSNRRHPSAKKIESISDQVLNDTSKLCLICNKTFPSHASLIIHKRTHSGEQPFNCNYCNKGFNVKSNLLRHLRTLHNKIINSSDVETSHEDSNSN